jgi:hypothetical protein
MAKSIIRNIAGATINVHERISLNSFWGFLRYIKCGTKVNNRLWHEHPGAYCLLGMLNMYELSKYEEAESHFGKALASDINHIGTYYSSYADLLIQTSEHGRAKREVDCCLPLD